MKPILVVEQEYSLRGLGLLGERLAFSGLSYRRLGAGNEAIEGLDARDFAAIVAMGGNAHAWDDDGFPFLASERRLLPHSVDLDVPAFGIFLGRQLLRIALGGDVRSAGTPESGLLAILPMHCALDASVFRVPELR